MTETAPEPMTGAQSLVRSLEQAGVEVIFGIPGGAILPAYDPLFDSSIRHVLVRHEQGAGHAAQGYAMATGKVGVCMATSGPGATNLVTAIADAYLDSVPIVAVTGQVASSVIGSDAFQEADIRGITMPITKHSFLVTDPGRDPARRRGGLPHRLHRSSRPGPGRRRQGRPPGDDHLRVAARARAAGLPAPPRARTTSRSARRRASSPRRRSRSSTSAARHQGRRVGRAGDARRADADPGRHPR